MKNRKTYLLRGLLVLLAAALVLLIVGRQLAAPARVEAGQPEERADYESAVVEQVLSDSTEKAPAADNGYRGEQLLLVTVKSGDYQGQQMQVYNYVGPLYGGPLHAGDRATILISSYSDGTVNATVYEFDRLIPLAIVVALFIAAAVIVGGRTGAKSLVALAVTLMCLFGVLLPALMKGANTLLMTFIVCAYVAVVSLTIVGGVQKKSVCAMLGAVAGTALALLFGLLAQALTRVDGLRIEDVEPLLQLHQHPVRQPLPEPRAAAADGGGGGRSLWRGVSVPGFPARVPGGPAGGPGAGILYAEILRLRVQRGGPLPQADRPGPEAAGEDHPGLSYKKRAAAVCRSTLLTAPKGQGPFGAVLREIPRLRPGDFPL